MNLLLARKTGILTGKQKQADIPKQIMNDENIEMPSGKMCFFQEHIFQFGHSILMIQALYITF